MATNQLYAPNGLPIEGALTVKGTVAKLLQFERIGGHSDYVFEVPEHPMVSPTVLVDSEGGQWAPLDVEIGALPGR